ncbi:MAG: hypothetical protein JNM56_30605 [Planctomycetia bacterium]|nr:hypothetical protein [Planctomycetia bacterium]
MAVTSRRWQLVGLILATLACMACNPLTATYFLFVGMDPKFDPKFKLAGNDKKKPTKVVVLTSTPQLELRPELIGAERELATLFAQILQQGCEKNKESIMIASPTKVQKFKDDHPSWQSLSLEEIGKKLETDFIVELEIREMSLYEAGSQNTFFKGRTAISVTVADVREPGKNPVFSEEYTGEFPRSQGPRLVTDTNPQKFRREFLTRVAAELTWLFTAHPTQDQYNCE